jgi:hypothetical protein
LRILVGIRTILVPSCLEPFQAPFDYGRGKRGRGEGGRVELGGPEA